MEPDDRTAGKTPSPFHIAEYQILHSELLANYQSGFNVVIYATIANGFIIAWILQYLDANPTKHASVFIAVAIPILLTFFSILKFRHCTARVTLIFMYFNKMEEIYREYDLGFQHFYRTSDHGKYLKHSHIAYLLLGIQLFLLLIFSFLVILRLL